MHDDQIEYRKIENVWQWMKRRAQNSFVFLLILWGNIVAYIEMLKINAVFMFFKHFN